MRFVNQRFNPRHPLKLGILICGFFLLTLTGTFFVLQKTSDSAIEQNLVSQQPIPSASASSSAAFFVGDEKEQAQNPRALALEDGDTLALNEELGRLADLLDRLHKDRENFDFSQLEGWYRYLQEIAEQGGNPAELRLLAEQFLPAYATVDGESALQKSLEWFPKGPERDRVLSQILPELGWESRDRVSEMIPAISSKEALVDALFHAALDFTHAAGEDVLLWEEEIFPEGSAPPEFSAVAGGVIVTLAKTDPGRAAAVFSSHVPDSIPQEVLPVWMDVVETVATQLGKNDPGAAEQWAQGIRDPALRSLATFTTFTDTLDRAQARPASE